MKTSEVMWDLIDLAITGMAGVTRRIAFMQKPTPKPPPSADISETLWSRVQAGKTYLKALFKLVLYCSLFPLPILALGMVSKIGWLVAIVGIFWALCTLILLVLATPVGFLIEVILGGIKGIGTRYVRFSLSVLLIELLFSLFVSVVPIHNNPAAIPIVILASAALGILGALGIETPMSQRVIAILVTTIFIIFTFSFFFPQTFKTFTDKGKELDSIMSGQVGEPTSTSENPHMPPGGLMETPKEIAEYESAVTMWRNVIGDPLKKDVISIPISLTKLTWSNQVSLLDLKPRRTDYAITTNKKVSIKLSDDWTSATLYPDRYVNFPNKPPIFKFLAENSGTVVVITAWNVRPVGKTYQTNSSQQPGYNSTKSQIFPSVSKITGIAYSYSKKAWAALYHQRYVPGNGRYPKVSLIFSSGNTPGTGKIEWNGLYSLMPHQISLKISELSIGASNRLQEFYTDIGIGFDVQLENAIFPDYTIAKSILVFRTFGGDSPPREIEKNYEIKVIEPTENEPYLMQGEWVGSYQIKRWWGSTTSSTFIARFVQKGNKFEGVMVDSYVVTSNTRHTGKVRSRIEGIIVDDKVSFVKTDDRTIFAVNYVADFTQGVPSLAGECSERFDRGQWKMTRRGDFVGTVDDILDVNDPNP